MIYTGWIHCRVSLRCSATATACQLKPEGLHSASSRPRQPYSEVGPSSPGLEDSLWALCCVSKLFFQQRDGCLLPGSGGHMNNHLGGCGPGRKPKAEPAEIRNRPGDTPSHAPSKNRGHSAPRRGQLHFWPKRWSAHRINANEHKPPWFRSQQDSQGLMNRPATVPLC